MKLPFDYLKFPVALLYVRDLKDREKILLAFIGTLCEKTAELVGDFYTTATTEELYGLSGNSKRTFLRTLAQLEKKGYLHLKYGRNVGTYKGKRETYLTSKSVKVLFGLDIGFDNFN